MQDAEDALGPLHGLVNNAAHCELPDSLINADRGLYRRHYDVNLGAPAMLMAEFARYCARRDQARAASVELSRVAGGHAL